MSSTHVVRGLTHQLVILFAVHAEGGGPEGFGIVGAGEVSVIHEDELVQDEGWDQVQPEHERGAYSTISPRGLGMKTGREIPCRRGWGCGFLLGCRVQ